MLDISKIHPHTLAACLRYKIDISQYDSLEELRAEFKRRNRNTHGRYRAKKKASSTCGCGSANISS